MDESPSFAPEEDLLFMNIFKHPTEANKLQSTNISASLLPEVDLKKMLNEPKLKLDQKVNVSEVKSKPEAELRPRSK